MAWGVFGRWFGAHERLPNDQVTRIPWLTGRTASEATAGMRKAIEELSGLPGIADIRSTHRLPRGFSDLVAEVYRNYDAFISTIRDKMGVPADAKRPGEPGGTAACYVPPMGLHSIESLNLYRTARALPDFQPIATRLAELGEQQFKDIQAGHSGKDPEKIRMGGKAFRQGRLAFAKRMQPCPFLDENKQRCQVWENRPIACRMHHPTTNPEWSRPDNEHFPHDVKAINLRPPVRAMVDLQQLDKRLDLQHSPFMYASLLQVVELTQGQMLQEVGEAPVRLQQDGRIVARANRNVKHAKKYQKKGKSKPKRRK